MKIYHLQISYNNKIIKVMPFLTRELAEIYIKMKEKDNKHLKYEIKE